MSENLDPGYAGEGLYRENILEHYKHPQNKGRIAHADIHHHESNPLCGDEIFIDVKLNSKKALDIKFDGRGCAISQAAASMLTEAVKGKTLEEIQNLKKEDMLDLLSIPIGPVRMKCALLAWDTLQSGIRIFERYKKGE